MWVLLVKIFFLFVQIFLELGSVNDSILDRSIRTRKTSWLFETIAIIVIAAIRIMTLGFENFVCISREPVRIVL